MRDKMKNRNKEKEKKSKLSEEHVEADIEKFIETFEKPTQIYRFLRTRHAISPIFLQRTLSYMKHRGSVSKSSRREFLVDSILGRKESVKKEETNLPLSSQTAQYLKLNFVGFFDTSCPLDVDDVEVEAVIAKTNHIRKDNGKAHSRTVSVGKVLIPVNPVERQSSLDGSQSDIGGCGAELVSRESFDFTQCDPVETCTLHLWVNVKPSYYTNGVCNGDSHERDDPVPKKRKSVVNGKTLAVEEDVYTYRAELTIYGGQGRCILTNGEYDLIMQEMDTKPLLRKDCSWAPVHRQKMIESVEMFNKCATLKFRLTWTDDQEGYCPSKIQPSDYMVNNQHPNIIHVSDTDSPSRKVKEECQSTPQKKTQVVYQFMYNENTRQQTNTRDNMRCPWCHLNCEYLYSLLKHLRVYHSRFNILYVPHPKAAHIHVSINDSYDGSYAGDPHDLNSHIGYAFSRLGPVRRTSITHVIVYRPKRPSPTLLEFCEPEKENQVCRQIIQGHNRLYFRTKTCLPLQPQEVNHDSEDETTPQWLQQKSINLIEEFTDVNEGEKEIMKMWNLHCMKYAYISDCQMLQACQSFIEEHGLEVVQQDLVKNFLLHLVNMFDFGLITPDVVQRTMWQLNLVKDEMEMNGQIPLTD